MSRTPLHALIWSQEQRLYELHTQNRLEQRFQPTDEATWQSWLREVTSFAFHSPAGSLNVYLERRPRGGAYWYAYQTKEGRTRKRYLGRTETLSLAHLEETALSLRREQQPPQAFDQGMLVLSGRLAPPRLPAALVERESLLSALDEALSTPLTLLSAPAGFGKTTLLSAWASRHQAQVAWLSLDELDNSPTRFWVALIAALRRCGRYAPSFGETVVALLESPQPPPLSTILTALLQELESPEAHPAAFGRGGAPAGESHGGLDRRLAPGGPHPAEARGSHAVSASVYRQPALSVGLCAAGDPGAPAHQRARLFTAYRHPLAPGSL